MKSTAILLRGGGSIFTGYGSGLISLAIELDKRMEIGLWLTDTSMGLPRDFTVILERDLPKNYAIYLEFTTPLMCKGKQTNAYTILYTMWEQTEFLKNVKTELFPQYDLIVVPNKANAELFKKYVEPSKVAVVPLGIDVGKFKYRKRALTGPIKFCMMGYMSKRKGIDIAIDAFKEVSSKYDCYLDIHNTGIRLPEEWYNIPKCSIVTAPFNPKELLQWYYEHDVMLAVSRGEGYNLPAVEFLSTGGSVVGANFMGQEMWLGSDYAYPINYEIVPVTCKAPWQNPNHMFIDEMFLDGKSMWAEPNLQEVIKAMESCIIFPGILAGKMLNTRIIREQFNIKKTTDHLLSVISKHFKEVIDAKEKTK